MEEHRATCEAEHRYVEAEMAKNRIAELKEQEFSRAQEELIFMHEQQRQECEQAHIKQYQEFNEHWDNELQQAQQEDQNEILQMEERHTQYGAPLAPPQSSGECSMPPSISSHA